jgi:hypothetical protein
MLENAKITDIGKIVDPRGELSFIQNDKKNIPFDIKRIYYMYNIADGADRGHHAMKTQQKFIIAIHGSFDLVLKDGINERIFHLDSPDKGVLIEGGLWREMKNFTTGTACLVLASEIFIEADHIRNYEEFLRFKKLK